MKNIVILGGGFGGVKAALVLEKKLKKLPIRDDYEIILVDRKPHHTFTPLLYEVATTSKKIAIDAELKSIADFPLTEIFQKKNVTIVNDSVLHIDVREGTVHLKKGEVRFEYLVIALGAEVNYFDIPGLEENALTFKTFTDAILLRDALSSPVKGSETRLRVVIGGGGSTGVEIASEIKESRSGIDVMIIEALRNILPGFDEGVVSKVEKRLKKIGVAIIRNEPIDKVTKKEIWLKSGERIAYDFFIWTGGVKATSLTQKMPIKKEKRGRIEITENLECIPAPLDLKIYPVRNKPLGAAAAVPEARRISNGVYGKIYAIGDIACIMNPKANLPVSQVARAAITQGKIAAKNIIEDIKKQNYISKKVKDYVYRPVNYPYIIPVGDKYAVAKIGPIVISGFLARIFKCLVELNYFLSIMNLFKAFKTWLHGLRVFIQNDRLG